MLLLVRSKEPAIKGAVVDAYKRIYLNAKGANARAQAVAVANALIALTIGASLGDMASLNELIQEFVRTKELGPKVIQVFWEKFALKISPTTQQESRGALLLIGMVAGAEIETVKSNVGTLIKEGLGPRADSDFLLARDTCLALIKLAPKSKSVDKPYRFSPDHELFERLSHLLVDGITQLDKVNWIPMAEQAINLIYRLAERPDTICGDIVRRQASQILAFKCEERATANIGAVDTSTQQMTGDQPVPHAATTAELFCSSGVLSRFLFVCGHVALQQLIHLDVAVFGELKRRRALSEINKQTMMAPPSTSNRSKTGQRASVSTTASIVASASKSKNSASEQTIEEEMGLAGAVAEDAEAECIRRVAETQIVTGNETLLAVLQPLVVAMCSNQSKYNDPDLSAAATLALTKFMVVSSEFCEQQLQLLFTIFEKSSHAVVRANAVIAIGDLTFRFPNLIEPWTANIYARLRDDSTQVRKNTLLVLTHLILNDMIKVKGQISELATCVIDDNPQIAGLAKVFFSDLSKRGNAIYNILPDIISRLSDPDVGISEENFREILRYLMSFIQKDKQCESLVEKLCHRFRATRCERQWRDLAFCLSLLSYNDRSIRKLQENFGCFGDKLSEEFVYSCFTTIISGACKFAKPEAKVIIDEFEQRVEETYKKGVADDEVAQKASKVSVTAAAKATRSRNVATKTPGGRKAKKQTRGKPACSDDDIDEIDENSEEIKQEPTTQPATTRRATRKKPALVFSSDDEDDDFDDLPKKAGGQSEATARDNDDDVDSDSCDEVPAPGQTIVRKNVRSVCSRANAAHTKVGRRK
jgi:condensin complex subunit 1